MKLKSKVFAAGAGVRTGVNRSAGTPRREKDGVNNLLCMVRAGPVFFAELCSASSLLFGRREHLLRSVRSFKFPYGCDHQDGADNGHGDGKPEQFADRPVVKNDSAQKTTDHEARFI